MVGTNLTWSNKGQIDEAYTTNKLVLMNFTTLIIFNNKSGIQKQKCDNTKLDIKSLEQDWGNSRTVAVLD